MPSASQLQTTLFGAVSKRNQAVSVARRNLPAKGGVVHSGLSGPEKSEPEKKAGFPQQVFQLRFLIAKLRNGSSVEKQHEVFKFFSRRAEENAGEGRSTHSFSGQSPEPPPNHRAGTGQPTTNFLQWFPHKIIPKSVLSLSG